MNETDSVPSHNDAEPFTEEATLLQSSTGPLQDGMVLVSGMESVAVGPAAENGAASRASPGTVAYAEPASYYPRDLSDMMVAAKDRVRQLPRGVRIAALAASALALAGCTDKGADVAISKTSSLPRDAVVRQIDADIQARVEANDRLRDVVTNSYTADDLEDYLEAQPTDTQADLADVAQAIDYAKGDNLVRNIIYGDDTPEELAAQQAEITNPRSQELAQRAEGYREAEETLETSDGVADLEEYPTIKVELAQVEQSIRARAMASLEGHFALDVVEKVGYGELSQEQALKMIGFIQDKGLRDQVAEAIKLVVKDEAAQEDYDGDSYRYYDKAQAMRDQLRERVEAADKAMEGWKKGIVDEADKLAEEVREIYDASEEKIEQALIQNASGLESLPITNDTIKLPADPTQNIDFSTLKITEMIPNDAKLSVQYQENDIMTQDKLPQFAEVYVESGVMKFRVAEGSGLAPQSEQAMQQVIDNVSPLIVEAFKSGQLNGLHFVMVDNEHQFNGSYGPSRDAYVLVPKTHMTAQALQLVIGHEVIGHGLTEANIEQADMGSEDAQAIDRVCSAVRSTVHKQLELSLDLSTDKIDALATVVDPTYQAALMELKNIIRQGGLRKALSESLGQEHASAVFNDCIATDIDSALIKIAAGVSVKFPEGTSLRETYGQTPEYQELAKIWNQAVAKNNIYAYLNESYYTDVLNDYEDKMGHSGDRVNELAASVINITIHYPDQMVQTILGLQAPEQASAVASLRLSMTLAGKGVSPGAKAFFEDRFHYIMNGIAKGTPAGS